MSGYGNLFDAIFLGRSADPSRRQTSHSAYDHHDPGPFGDFVEFHPHVDTDASVLQNWTRSPTVQQRNTARQSHIEELPYQSSSKKQRAAPANELDSFGGIPFRNPNVRRNNEIPAAASFESFHSSAKEDSQDEIRKKIDYHLSQCENIPWEAIEVDEGSSWQGGQGKVRRGRFRYPGMNNRYVAVKDMQLGKNEKDCLKRLKLFIREIKTLQYFRDRGSEHVVWLFGYCLQFDHQQSVPRIRLVTEWIEYGSVHDFLQSAMRNAIPLSCRNRIKLCLGIARAVAELHEVNITHGDIKPHNFLLKDPKKFQVLAADFGLVNLQLSEVSHTATTNPASKLAGGTHAYSAPELYELGQVATKASDIYALAITFWSILFMNLTPHGEKDVRQLTKFVLQKSRLPLDNCRPLEMRTLIHNAWAETPSQRGDVQSMIKSLQKMLDDYQDEQLTEHRATVNRAASSSNTMGTCVEDDKWLNDIEK